MNAAEKKLAELAARNLAEDPSCKAQARREALRAMCTNEEGTLAARTMALPAHEFSAQLGRMAEANAVLQRAWEAEMFEDCFFGHPHLIQNQSASADAKLLARITGRAYEILAEQYPDLKVLCREPGRRQDPKQCWVRVLASGQ